MFEGVIFVGRKATKNKWEEFIVSNVLHFGPKNLPSLYRTKYLVLM